MTDKSGRFRKLPVEVEAFRLGTAWPDWWGVAHMANRVTTHNVDDRHRDGPDFALIHTLEGQMRAEFGDWIIRGVKGEIYPCKPDVFALTYEPAACTEPQIKDYALAERDRIVLWLLEVGDDFPWTGLDIANFIRSGCEPWPEGLRRPADELAELLAQGMSASGQDPQGLEGEAPPARSPSGDAPSLPSEPYPPSTRRTQ